MTERVEKAKGTGQSEERVQVLIRMPVEMKAWLDSLVASINSGKPLGVPDLSMNDYLIGCIAFEMQRDKDGVHPNDKPRRAKKNGGKKVRK